MCSLIDDKELKKIELDILIRFASFCESQGLRYYLASGTLLGAVRHGGFIPWDDDIDVIMPRPDYEKFLTLAKNGFDPDIDILNNHNASDYAFPFTKAINNKTVLIESTIGKEHPTGVCIDIFPSDGLPDGNLKTAVQFCKLKMWRKLHQYSYIDGLEKPKNYLSELSRFIFVPICKKIGPAFFIEKINRAAQKYPFDSGTDCAVVIWGYGEKEIIPRTEFVRPIKVSFEGHLFNAPGNYDLHLTNLYGSYMEPPAPNQRNTIHDFTAHWKETKN